MVYMRVLPYDLIASDNEHSAYVTSFTHTIISFIDSNFQLADRSYRRCFGANVPYSRGMRMRHVCMFWFTKTNGRITSYSDEYHLRGPSQFKLNGHLSHIRLLLPLLCCGILCLYSMAILLSSRCP